MTAPQHRRPHTDLNSAERLGTALRRARREMDWTQTDLAAKSGISRPQISAIESGKADVRASTLLRLLRVLDCRLEIHPVDHTVFQLDDYLDRRRGGPGG